ncbi:MAG TPA: RNA polymerase sigma factor [Pyrinomonadaceae bacterium]|jgi:RNA polymerase sigma-70 factor (ECF subfamily)
MRRHKEERAVNSDPKAYRHDNELARLAGDGDTEAFEEIYRRYHRVVYAVALRMTGNREDAEDLTQDSFISLLRKIGSFRGEATFVSWLYRLTVNQVLMHFRRRRSRPEDQTSDGEIHEPRYSLARPFNSNPLIDRIAIERAVQQLPQGYRTTFILYDVEGHEHEEIARMMKRTAGTSKSQLHKARARLREMLSPPPPMLQSSL